MLLLEFDRGLFILHAKTPALDVLFHLPPRYGKRNDTPRLLGGFYQATEHPTDFFQL